MVAKALDAPDDYAEFFDKDGRRDSGDHPALDENVLEKCSEILKIKL